ncbi:RecQ family ATP-dependent DNA helicase [Terrimonas alba]|uniref:RecQ family ATP-dependent DNA helicase n=1 Tax=Terrimonas alba TaxID=3349636 RepID=UPI0035F48F14
MFNLKQLLKTYWGFDSFRPLQEEIIHAVLNGNDTLALMPTGGGKSLCYQVPAMAKEGTCLVISPLIALMKDQVEHLRKKNITAYAIYSGMNYKEVVNTLKVVTESNCKFLYVSPERLETALFKEYLPGMGIELIAVDEAHCISQWGYDFRPPYLRIAALREELPRVPVLALTASANPEVQKDICEKLTSPLTPLQRRGEQSMPIEDSQRHWKVFRQSFERANLSYSVFHVDSRINKIIEILNKVPGTGIIYCKSRKRTKEISELLHLQNISSDYYHAGLAQEERNRKQEAWINNKIRVIVCTNAFGMGIDKPDVRSVIHADMPDCLENYYQEAGRAGRDGKRAYAVLLYDEKELSELAELAALRFPPQDEIRKIYHSVANYLQIPVGVGEGIYYDFDIADFLKKFKHDSHTALYSLKALEQEGWLSFNEQVFRPSTVQFTVTKDRLYSFEADNSRLEPVLKTLLRAYEGIFDHPSFISELVVAQLIKKDVEEVKQQLHEIDRAGIIEYIPRKDTPQLYFLRNRIKTEELTINMAAYKQRKEKFLSRSKQMIHFVKEELQCRSQVIGFYFGDDALKPCGICDNCLRQKTVELTRQEFDSIHTAILKITPGKVIHIKDLLLQLNDVKKEKAWKVIEFLQAENKIKIDDKGWLRQT